MKRRTMLIMLGAGLLSACGEAIDRRADAGPPAHVTVLDDNLSALKTAFNAAHDDVRLLFIVGPTCGPCLRGLIDLNSNLGPSLLADRRLSVFIVAVPTLSAQLQHAQRAAQLMTGASVQHYWDPHGKSGEVVQQTLQIPEYAWDVWLTYDPGPVWDAAAPPAPATWSHQLGGLRQGTRLNPPAFAADVRARVDRIA